MNTDLNLSATLLSRGSLQRIEDGKGTLVQCLGGTLWLTQEYDARDIVLEAGDEVRIERNGLSILTALRDARFVLLRDAAALNARLRARGARAALAAH
jgi:hypothetical protein